MEDTQEKQVDVVIDEKVAAAVEEKPAHKKKNKVSEGEGKIIFIKVCE